jgi:chromosome segregation ATPase
VLFRSQNDAYLAQIREIKEEHNNVLAALERAQACARDNESLISALKSEIAAVSGQKLLIDEELKKTNGERYEILKKFEEKSKEFETYRLRYESEISALREEKAKEAGQYRARLEDAALRLRTEEGLVAELKGKIAALETQKLPLDATSAARKAIEQTDEIISLKNQLAKAENR